MSRGLKGLSASAVSEHISHYSSAIECKASASKSGLVELDAWYQSLPFSTVSSPCSGLDSKESLLKLVRWKLGREKHRPALLSLVSSNPPDLVNKTLRKAATYLVERKLTLDSDDDDLLSGVVGAMEILITLRGVGPATASAICAAWNPAGIFQSDHLVELLDNRTKVKYTLPFYKAFYKNAIRTVKDTHGMDSGKSLDRLAFSLAHPDPSPSHLQDKQDKPDKHDKKEEKQQPPKRSVSPPAPATRPKRTRRQ